MRARPQPYPAMRPGLGALLALAMLCTATGAAGEEHRQPFGAPARQTAPQPQTFRSMSPVQTPAAAVPPATWQYNPSATAHTQQYNPPGLNSASGTYPTQNNSPGLTTPQEMTTPGGLGSVGGQAGSQNTPGPGFPGAGGPGQGGGGSSYPVGYQAPSAFPPPYPYQGQPAYSRQFTCRTAHYFCVVPYTGWCECENDRRERERGATVD